MERERVKGRESGGVGSNLREVELKRVIGRKRNHESSIQIFR